MSGASGADLPAVAAGGGLALADAERLERFAAFLRLNVAHGDASPATVRTYLSQVRRFWEWCASAGVSPEGATAADLAAYRRHLIEAGLARATVATRLAVLRRFYAAAQSWGLRADNPAAGVRAPRERTDRAARVKYLPLEGVRRLLRLPERRTAAGKRDRALLCLLALHGLRVAEACALTAGDYKREEPAHLLVTGKGGKVRRAYLVPTSRKALEAWLKARPASGTEALFVALDRAHWGAPLTVRGARAVVDRYLAAAGLKARGVSCHALRHSFATLAYAAGADLLAVSEALGHASVTTTQVYARVVDAVKANPALKLERCFREDRLSEAKAER